MRFCSRCKIAHENWTTSTYSSDMVICDICHVQRSIYASGYDSTYRGTSNLLNESSYDKFTGELFSGKAYVVDSFNDKLIAFDEKEGVIKYLTVYWQAMESFRQTFSVNVLDNPKMPCDVKIAWAKQSLKNIERLLEKAETLANAL